MIENLVTLIDSMGNDLTVVNSARVSLNKESFFNDNGELKDEDIKLIKYLAKHNHWTPFSQVTFQFRIKMPIFIARQYFRSNVGLTRNEVSRRYVSDPPEFWEPTSWRSRPENVKQGSGEDLPEVTQVYFFEVYRAAMDALETSYNAFIQKGCCPEQARALLPQSMMTEFIETGSLAAYARVYTLRKDSHAQVEIQEYADLIGNVIKNKTPHSWRALTEG